MASNIAVFAIFPDRTTLEEALNSLEKSGFRSTDVSVLVPENEGNKDLVHQKTSKSPEGTAAGGAVGAVLGGTLGWLTGIGALAIPGFGPFLAAGPIMATLAGLGVGAATGGIAGALIGMGIPEFEAKRFSGRVKKGGILLSVHCDDAKWATIAKKLLASTGGEDVSSTHEAKPDYQHSDRPISRTSAR
jgi:hypothetical protein